MLPTKKEQQSPHPCGIPLVALFSNLSFCPSALSVDSIQPEAFRVTLFGDLLISLDKLYFPIGERVLHA